jgi:hypothetical protein
MARMPKIGPRGGPGFIGLIVFIVLSVLLLGGYGLLVPGYAKRGSSLNQLHKDIKDNLEDKLAAPLGIRALAVASASDAAYDAAFFGKVRDAALKGVSYDNLRKAAGYMGDDPISEIKQELATQTPAQEDLRAHVNKLKADFQFEKNRADTADINRKQAEKAREDAQQALKQATDRYAGDLAAAEKAKQDLIAKQAVALEEAKKRWMALDTEVKKGIAEKDAVVAEHKKQVAALEGRITKLDATAMSLREELEKKKPVEVPTLEGKILQVNLVDGVAVIGIGRREGVKLGEKFDVMRVGKGGSREKKGEIQIIRVDELISRADVMQPSLEDPIMRDDPVVRQKRLVDPSELGK